MRTLRDRVLAAIKGAGKHGLSDHDLVRIFPSHPLSSLNARRAELVNLGLVVNSGKSKLGPYNRLDTIWIAT